MKKVSLIIPLKNEESGVQLLIDSIRNQARLPDEVIFVDGGSTDKTRDIIRRNLTTLSFQARLVKGRKLYPGEARNIGIKKSVCELIAFTDAGIKLDRDWLKELVLPMEKDENIDVVYGSYEPVINSFLKECSLMAYLPAKEKPKSGMAPFRTNSIASSLFKKDIREKCGYFPPFRAAEDKIFMDKVKQSGAGIAYADKAVVYWEIPKSVKGIFARFSEFSAHDILAGRAKDWHHSVFRIYGIFLVSFILGILANPAFFVALPAAWILRIARIFVKKKEDFTLKFLINPRYLFTIIFIVFLTDMALFCGTLKYVKGAALCEK